MKAKWDVTSDAATLRVTWEDGDLRQISREARSRYQGPREDDAGTDFTVAQDTITFRHSFQKHPHPDLLGFASMLVLWPFARHRLVLDPPISRDLADVAKSIMQIDVGPHDPTVTPRTVTNGRPALSYSAGIDSIAAHDIMPAGTPMIYLARTPIVRDAKYRDRTDFPREAMKRRSLATGAPAYIVDTDEELLLDPPSYPTHQAVGVPLLLLADEIDANAAAFGTVFHRGSHRLGTGKFIEAHDRSSIQNLQRLYEVVALDYMLPTGGLTEVATAKLAHHRHLTANATSCTRATADHECMRCRQCFWMHLVRYGLKGDNEEALEEISRVAPVRNLLGEIPSAKEHLFGWALSRQQPRTPMVAAMRRRYVEASPLRYDWAERLYPTAADLVPRAYWPSVRREILKTLELMDEKDIEYVRQVDYNVLRDSRQVQQYSAQLGDILAKR